MRQIPSLHELLSMRLVQALLSGAIAVTLQTTVFEFVSIFFHLVAPSTGTVLGAECGILANFFLNNRYSFGDRGRDTQLASRLIRFHFVTSGSVALQWISVFICEHLTSSVLTLHIVYIVGIIVGFVWNYTMYQVWVWKTHPDSVEEN